ncbi:Bacterial type II and III secretion system protein [Stieleria maiorica]|uniref:Bacterial type II and III secretion system protein n=1 Tax=Stieleria maiorica TaxID=2795974 RepID=A0A5B9MI58_9BACT|nr:hypothetical protein [Stieleria maiorica]QEF99275.1 Bacterial type II and III secretion system protein [Stieleria maiorica]
MNVQTLVAVFCIFFSAAWLSADEPVQSAEKHSIRIQVLLVESPDRLREETRRLLSGPTQKVLSTVAKLEREERVTLINHADMTVLEDSECMLQIGETVPIRTGTIRSGSGQVQTSYQSTSTGTIIQLRSRVSGEHVLVELDFTKSGVKSISDEQETPQGTAQLTHQTTIQIRDGSAIAVGGLMQQSDDQKKEILFIVTANILESSNLQVMKFQSFSRPPTRAGVVASPPGRAPSPGRPSQEEIRKRMSALAEMMFARADLDKDGLISKDELAKLAARDLDAKPPITKQQYAEWMKAKWESRQRSSGRAPRVSGFHPPEAPSRTSPTASERNDSSSEIETENADMEASDIEGD